jgi:tRNA pseudouridine55 synthase
VPERTPTARRVPGPVTDGLVVIDKPAGWTSHDVVARCRGIFGQKKVGHAGTLDPDATGVLLLIVFGVSTSTLDASGEVTGRWDMDRVTLADAAEATAKLTGPIAQIPPMVSAIKIGGRRLHDLARQGIVVERPARHVTVTRFALSPAADGDPGPLGGGPVFTAEVECSAGTYMRSLAADLGTLLGGGAHLRNLRRTAIGPFTLADAVGLDAVGADRVIAPAAAMRGVTQVSVGADLATAIGFGKVLDRADLGAAGDGPWAVIGPGGDLLAVYQAHGGGSAKPAVVLRPQVTGDR